MNKDFDTFKGVFDSLSTRNGFFAKLRVLTMRYRWHTLVGETIARRSCISDFREGVLYVSVTEGLWAHELGLHKRPLIQRLNRELGMNIVKDMKITIGRLDDMEESDEEQI
ncbi:MAG TPA: hypothetical protein DCE14_00385 [Kosmotogaceae bacterium]|nr:MAG: Zn-ribbon-containing protein [Thermotogales bacterium 46_20]HAA84804.1 hypothetical protein [Kosmotogaceae bacterium]